MATTTTPNMGLNLPVPGSEPGPEYANDNNAAFTVIDAHTHSAGNGVPITPSGLNINADLAFQSANAYQLRSARFTNNNSTLVEASDLCCVYASGGNLYYNNSSGTAVQITSGSSVNAGAGSITGLPSGTASVTFSASTYVFQSATSTPATIDVGSAIIRNTTASAKGVTVSPVNALAADYALFLPTIPASQSFLTIDTSGNIAAYAAIANGISRTNLVAVGQQVSSSCGAYSSAATGPADVTNLSVTITTSGRPVMLMLQPDGTSSPASIGMNNASASASVIFGIYRGASSVMGTTLSDSNGTNLFVPPGVLSFLDVVGAGTYTYKVKAWIDSGGATSVNLNYCVLMAYEL